MGVNNGCRALAPCGALDTRSTRGSHCVRGSAPGLERAERTPGPPSPPPPPPQKKDAGRREAGPHVRRWLRAEGRPRYSLSHSSSAAVGPADPSADSVPAATAVAVVAAMSLAPPRRPRAPLPPAAAANWRAPGLPTRQARGRT